MPMLLPILLASAGAAVLAAAACSGDVAAPGDAAIAGRPAWPTARLFSISPTGPREHRRALHAQPGGPTPRGRAP